MWIIVVFLLWIFILPLSPVLFWIGVFFAWVVHLIIEEWKNPGEEREREQWEINRKEREQKNLEKRERDEEAARKRRKGKHHDSPDDPFWIDC